MSNELRTMRRLVQEMGWGQFMRDVGSLMAEQADKTGGEQSGNLFECSRTIHCLNEFFEKCGKFEYPAELLIERL